jgi:hypothetical protein
MQDRIVLKIKGRQVRAIYHDALAGLLDDNNAEVRRASHVEPATDCRGWYVDLRLVGGMQYHGPFRLRSEALAYETKWLLEHNIPQPKNGGEDE